MTVDNRLLSPFGTLIDRNQTVEFSFEEKTFSGYAGDTVASALAANNQWLLSRSFKYHRPRGVLTMAGQDANSMVQLPSDPNALADRIDISPGLKVMGQNYSGSLTRDRNAVLGLVSRFLPVAFYYKAFFKPRGMWQKWAPFFRQRAGLGRIDQSYQAEYHDKQYQFYDVAIVGGGPAGLSAALAAADSGASVLLVDENVRLGGSLNYARSDAEGTQSGHVRDALVARVEANPKIVAMSEATCNGWFSDNWLPIICRKRLYKVRAKKTILCVGAIEQPAIFHNNDLPGVMLGSAAQRLIKLYAVRPGQSAVVLTGNNDGYAVALDLIDAGVDVKAIVDLRDAPVYDAIAEHVSSLDIAVKIGHAVYAAKRNASGLHLGAVDVRKIVGRGRCTTESQTINCDTLLYRRLSQRLLGSQRRYKRR